ncbi:MAG: DEAD/DEAH box helicase family protein [Nitrososphaerales archaeon]
MSEKKCGPSDELEIRDYQAKITNEILNYLGSGKKNVFVSLQQGSGKTIIALLTLCNLVNEGSVSSVLVLIPRRVLVDQWVGKAQDMFYGLGLLRNPTLSKMRIETIRGWLKHSQALGIVMTDQSYQRYIKKAYFSESDFDLVIVDEAADSVVARDFIEGFRMSEYLSGLEKWHTRKIFLLPFHVSEKKIKAMMGKFGKESVLIRRIISDLPVFQYTINDPIVIDDPMINTFVEALEQYYRRIRNNVNRILTKYGVKEGYRENLETLLNPKVIEKVKRRYGVDDETLKQIKTLVTKYILVQHLRKWFLYSNREELSRSILASQFEVNEWLSLEDKKLNKLAEVVEDYIRKDYKICIFSQYVSTAELIESYLKERLNLKDRDIALITGLVENQWDRLDAFKRAGRILVTTPVLDKGADIPLVKGVAIVFTPPLSMEKLFQVVGRIRGGEVTFLAYNGLEEELMNQVAEELRRSLAEASGEKFGLNRFV